MNETTSSRYVKSNYIKRAVKRHLNDITSSFNTENDTKCNNEVVSFQYIYNEDTLLSDYYNFNDKPVKKQTYSIDRIIDNGTIPLLDDSSIYDHNLSSNQFLLDLSSTNFDMNNENIFNLTSNDENRYYSTCSSRDDDSKEVISFRNLLVKWSIKHNITHSSFSDLLKILWKYHEDLPKDCRTLLKSKSCFFIIVMKDIYGQDAEYVYLRIKSKLVSLLELTCSGNCIHNDVHLIFSIDGLPLYKSSAKQFWPLLCSVQLGKNLYKPFIISLFCGKSKPKSTEVFLADFVTEFSSLRKYGIFVNGNHFNIHAKAFVCDAPARAFKKGIKGHNVYYGCERCIQKGERFDSRTVFLEINSIRRTDASFACYEQEEHHKLGVVPPLLKLNIGHHSQFPLEYMDLVCLGATRRLLLHWLRGSRLVKISMQIADLISNEIKIIASHVTVEFSRKPRSLKEINRWKATEFRLFLCYIGPVVLRSNLEDKLYNHFMLLHVAITILISPAFYLIYIDYAEKLINEFVKQMPILYGKCSLNYTMHSIFHICDDVRKFGFLDEYSAFPFENTLGTIKRMLRSGRMPLQQLCRRISEREEIGNNLITHFGDFQTLLKKFHN
ncbi:uncharacterized protein LOC124813209 [Hydra vulgaris]|uniref:uncharacterized protein LOC124813209 n=1 Tax=Hydra vulgaris TaxID=6087 RepID=UPI001F5F15FA|nr:uncharacterized protein LOC124813208 [Hydra vulgaris]